MELRINLKRTPILHLRFGSVTHQSEGGYSGRASICKKYHSGWSVAMLQIDDLLKMVVFSAGKLRINMDDISTWRNVLYVAFNGNILYGTW